MDFKVQMTSFRFQKLWFGHVALYYDYYVTPSINSSQFKMSSAESDSYQSESSGSENLSDIWSDDGEEKEQELNKMNEWNEWNHIFFQHKQCTVYNTTTG